MVNVAEDPGITVGLRIGLGIRGRVYYGFERSLVNAAWS